MSAEYQASLHDALRRAKLRVDLARKDIEMKELRLKHAREVLSSALSMLMKANDDLRDYGD